MSNKPVHVAIGVLLDGQGEKVLLSLRRKDAHQGGLWEFPGGKVEQGESVQCALARELQEELGIQPTKQRPLIRIRHDYPDVSVLLDVWLVTRFQDIPQGKEAQPLQWVPIQALDSIEFPEANRAIVQAIQLPDRYAITPYDGNDLKELIGYLNTMSPAERALIQLRLAQHTSVPELTELVAVVRSLGGRVLLNGDPEQARVIGADGVHLSRKRLLGLACRPLPEGFLVGASCHDALALNHAAKIGCDFVVLSPVATTLSHTEAEPLGWGRFEQLVSEAKVPVYALGGMTLNEIPIAWEHGGQGVAGIRGFWPAGAISE